MCSGCLSSGRYIWPKTLSWPFSPRIRIVFDNYPNRNNGCLSRLWQKTRSCADRKFFRKRDPRRYPVRCLSRSWVDLLVCKLRNGAVVVYNNQDNTDFEDITIGIPLLAIWARGKWAGSRVKNDNRVKRVVLSRLAVRPDRIGVRSIGSFCQMRS